MVLKTLVLVLLVTLSYAQDDIMMFNDTQLSEEGRAARRIQENYENPNSTAARMRTFFCIERTTEYDLQTSRLNVTFSEFEQDGNNVWTLFFQMPLLAYLDLSRKRALIDLVISILNYRGTPRPLTLDSACIGTYETYELTTFKESIIIHLYDSTNSIDANAYSSQFVDNIMALYRSSDPRVISYPGQSGIIAIDLTTSSIYNETGPLHPGATSSDGADPTKLAVFIGSWGFNYTFSRTYPGVSRPFSDITIVESRFADNPNPINYGLEAGDIVFAIIGSILLAIVSFLILLGYCIHPFFLA